MELESLILPLAILALFMFVWFLVEVYKKFQKIIEENRAIIQEQEQAMLSQQKEFDREFLFVRTQVLKRDNYRCVNCGKTGIELHIHHISPTLSLAISLRLF